MVSAWRNFKNIFSRPLFTIIFRPKMLKFHPYSILTGDTMVGFVIFCVLSFFALSKYIHHLVSYLGTLVWIFSPMLSSQIFWTRCGGEIQTNVSKYFTGELIAVCNEKDLKTQNHFTFNLWWKIRIITYLFTYPFCHSKLLVVLKTKASLFLLRLNMNHCQKFSVWKMSWLIS